MNKQRLYAAFALTAALILPGTLFAAQPDQTETRKEAVQLTKSVERAGRQIQEEADKLDSMRQKRTFSNRTHQNSLSRIKLYVNDDLQPALNRLAEIKPDLPQWHQDAIDQMRTSAANLAANASAAIENRNPSDTHRIAVLDPDYGSLVGNISDRASDLVEIADATEDYGTAQLKGREAGLAITAHD